jgi:hypothetical protein
MTPFHNTHATFPFIFKKEFPPPRPIHGGASHASFDLSCDENFEKSNKNSHGCCESYNLASGGGMVATMAIVASAFYSHNPILITLEKHETIRISFAYGQHTCNPNSKSTNQGLVEQRNQKLGENPQSL